MTETTYQDHFVYKHLPDSELQPDYLLTGFPYTEAGPLNCVHDLLDHHVESGNGDRICLRTNSETWTYGELQVKANQIAQVLIDDFNLQSGNRVLLRSANNPMMVACWFGILKAGGIVVATMPLLRAKELSTIVSCTK